MLKKRIESIVKYVDGIKIGVVSHGFNHIEEDVHILIGTTLEITKFFGKNERRCDSIKIACFDDADVTRQFAEGRNLTQTLIDKGVVILMCSSDRLNNQCLASAIPNVTHFNANVKLSPNISHLYVSCDKTQWFNEVEKYLDRYDLAHQVIIFTPVSKI